MHLQDILHAVRPFLLVLALGASQATPPGPLSAVAKINGVPLLQWEAERELASRITATSFHSRVSPEKQKQLRGESLDALVLKELKRQWAAEKKIVADPEAASAAWKKVRDRFPTQKAYEDALREQGLTDATFRKVFEREEAAGAADRAVKAAVPPPSDEEVGVFFEAHRTDSVKPEARHVVLALVHVDPGGGAPAWKSGREKAEELAARVRAGASFAEEVEKLKRDLPPKYRDQTGDLGFVHRGSVLPEIEKEIFDAEIPSFRGPIQTIYGYQVIQVLAARPAEPLAFASVRDAVAARIRQEREKEALETFESGLRKNARVERLEWASEP